MYSKLIKALILGIFFFSNISWAASQVLVVKQIELCMGKKGYRDFSGTAPWTYVSAGQSHTTSDAMDLEENGGTGDNGYVYMAYRTIVMYNYIDTQGNDERPITNIIIVDFGSSAEIQDVYYDPQGRMYHRVPITSQDGKTNYPLNRTKYTENHHFHVYYTRDYIDGKAITEIRASKTKTSGYSISGFETVKNQKGAYANINMNPNNSYLNYLHIKREEMPNRAKYTKEPYVKSSVTYSPFGVSLGAALYYGAYSASYYTQTHKIGNKYEDGKWNSRDNVYLTPGTHDVYIKLDPGLYDPIYVTGPYTITVDKISGTEHYNKYFKLKNSVIYSGEKLDIEWRDPCVDEDHFTGYAPSDAKYFYTPVDNISYIEINPSTFAFNQSGIYYLKVTKNENDYCKPFAQTLQIEVLQSKLIIKKNNGEADVVIEKNVGETITYTLPTLTWTGHTFKSWSRSVPKTMPAGVTTIEAQWTTNSYTLTVNPNAGSDNVYKNKASNCADEGNTSCYSNLFTKTTQSVLYQASLSPYRPSTLYRIGYSFNGWSSSESIMPAKSLTLTAQWNINKYTWTFDTDGGSTIAPITKNYRESVTKPSNPTKEGYDFIGWDKEIPSTMTAGNKTFKAQWKARTYYIRFENGYSNEVIKSVPKECDSDITDVTYPSNPKRTGYTFTGWNPSKLPSTMPAKNITVTATWDINKYQVTFPSKYMESITPQGFTGGKLDYNTTIKLKFKDEYKYLGTVTKNGDKLTAQNGIYTISYIAENVDIEIDTDMIYENYGSVLVKIDHSEAIIGYDSPETREIAKPIEVDSITYAKSFTKNVTESLMFPFEMDLRYIHGGIFCKFTGYDKEQNVIRMLFMRTKLAANTPYLIVPTSKNLTFNLSKGQKVAIQTSDIHSVREGDWEFRGTYDFTDWANLENEVGRAYIFNPGGTGDGVSGQFRKVTADDVLDPLHGYLIHNPINKVNRPTSAAFAAPSTANTFSLPEIIDVRIESENGGTTAIGHINTRTGEFKIDRWFDLNGKLLKEKPTTNGIYYNNGKKVIVK